VTRTTYYVDTVQRHLAAGNLDLIRSRTQKIELRRVVDYWKQPRHVVSITYLPITESTIRSQ
jgi:hypothetical protein